MLTDVSPVPHKKRQRARKACVPCRQRKRRCDGGNPCGMCVSYAYKCQYDEQGDPTALPTPLVPEVPDNARIIGPSNTRMVIKPPSVRAKILLNSTQCAADQGVFDAARSRYMGLSSAVAFARSLGIELQSANPPHLHSFAWNCGLRPEEKSNAHCALFDLITKEETYHFTQIYFSAVHPVFDVVDPEHFKKSVESYWEDGCKVSAFGAVVGGVVALGSLFSGGPGHPRELEIVQYSKSVLEDPTFGRLPSAEQVSAWVLRTLYLRATTRPHAAWLASCVTIHLAEASALHHEIENVELTANDRALPPRTKKISERARRLFWCAWSINSILSYDYGRSSASLGGISCKLPTKSDGNYTAQLVDLALIIPPANTEASKETRIADLLQALTLVYETPDEHNFLSLVKADLCNSFYRRLRLFNHTLDTEVVFQLTTVCNHALSAAYDLVERKLPWWNVLSAPFQYICVLLAINTSESLANVAKAKSIFDRIVSDLNTHMAIEAQNTIKLLLQDSIKKKKQELSDLEAADQAGTASEAPFTTEIDWDVLLDPSHALHLMQQDFSSF
ncbi:LAQU0S03e08724g1_1 [Lachancea quebecensis]|uniref:LAQU0S03e08724g1_1 n=1 Tax=Lachancea quebecensis TaxID=1654605 RepID=A0A0P1KRZ5_9SACH|nr:LAQU0S03e08724g1_1 [Lachancea quebecensis]